MTNTYSLKKVNALANGDMDFINAIMQAFVDEIPTDLKQLQDAVNNKNYAYAYQYAHKLKPTVDLFELDVLDDVIIIQDWGKLVKEDQDVSSHLNSVSLAIEAALIDIKKDYNL